MKTALGLAAALLLTVACGGTQKTDTTATTKAGEMGPECTRLFEQVGKMCEEKKDSVACTEWDTEKQRDEARGATPEREQACKEAADGLAAMPDDDAEKEPVSNPNDPCSGLD
jgi:hypothetical protein